MNKMERTKDEGGNIPAEDIKSIVEVLSAAKSVKCSKCGKMYTGWHKPTQYPKE